MNKQNKAVVFAAGLSVLGAAAGGGWYAFIRGGDPLSRAAKLLAAGNVAGAQLELRNAVRNDPNNADARLRLAQTQLQLGDPVAAEKELKSAETLGASHWDVVAQLGRAYLAQRKFKEALDEVPAAGPNPEALGRNMLLRSIAQAGLNDMAAATESMARAEAALPGDAEILLADARLALTQKDVERAESKANAALAAKPGQVEALLLKSQILFGKGERTRALAAINQAIELAPKSASMKLNRASQYMLDGQDSEAQADVDAVLAAHPQEAGAIYLNGVLLTRAGKFAEAQAELQKLGPAIQRFPRGLYFAALAAARTGQAGSAAEFATRYVNQAPDDAEGPRLLARLELDANRPQQAVTALKRAVANGHDDAQTLELLGRAYAAAGEASEAVRSLKLASEAAPTDASILTQLASLQMREGKLSDAATTLEKSVELSPSQPTAGEALVAASLAAGDLGRADEALKQLRAHKGDSEATGVLTGMVKLARFDAEGARQAFAETLRQYPDSVGAKLNLAKILALQGKPDESEALLGELLARKPDNVQALTPLVQLLAQSKRWPQAIEAVNAAHEAAPKNATLTAMLSDIYVRSGNPRKAVDLLQAEQDRGSLPPMLQGELARAQSAAGDTAGANATYRNILQAHPDDMAARQAQVELLLRSKDVPAAKTALREALDQAPGNLGVMSSMVALEAQTAGEDSALKLAASLRDNPANLPNSAVLKGDELMRAKRYADAAQAFRNEYKLSQTDLLALRLANASVALGNDDEASDVLRKQLARSPNNADAEQMLAMLDMKAKRYDAAQKQFENVLAQQPNNVIALNNLAWLYQQKGDDRARNLAQRAYMRAPTPETADTLGWIMVGQGDAKSAVRLLEQSSQQRPDDPALKYHLAVALNSTGRKEEAVKLLQPLVSRPDAFADRPAARKLLQALTNKS